MDFQSADLVEAQPVLKRLLLLVVQARWECILFNPLDRVKISPGLPVLTPGSGDVVDACDLAFVVEVRRVNPKRFLESVTLVAGPCGGHKLPEHFLPPAWGNPLLARVAVEVALAV